MTDGKGGERVKSEKGEREGEKRGERKENKYLSPFHLPALHLRERK